MDANILYSPRIRELFFIFCTYADATPFWSVEIVKEWQNNYLVDHQKSKKSLENAYKRMKDDFPKSEITLKKSEIEAVDFKIDLDDRHVIAAANKLKVNYVITSDKHLKNKKIDGIECISAKKFFEQSGNKVYLEEAIKKHVSILKYPKVTVEEYKDFLKKNLI